MRKIIRFTARLPHFFALIFLTSISVISASGQGNTEQKIWASYWTIQPGYTSVLQMKNNRIRDTLNVRVSIYFSGGEEYPLEPISVGPRQTIVLDLNDVISSLPPSIRSSATREGSLEVEYSATNPSALMGSVSVTNRQQGTAWNFFMYPVSSDLPVAPVRGAFWLYDEHTDGFVVAHNASELSMTVRPRFEISSMSYPLAPVQLGPGEALKLELGKELRRLGLRDVHAGGLEFTYEGAPDALKAHGVLFNGRGFSTEIDFTRTDMFAEPEKFTLRTPRFAVGEADPALGLPEDESFTPTLVIHNFNSEALDIIASLTFSLADQANEVQIPISMPAKSTRIISRHDLFRGARRENVDAWATMELSYSSKENGVSASLVSVSEDGKYSIRSVLNWVEASWREGWYWRADQEFNTLLGIYNSDSEDASVVVSLDYYVDGVRRSYELPTLTIGRRTSRMIDIGQVLARGVPDADGDVLPAAVDFGGYSVRHTGPRQFENITTEALIFNRQGREFLTIYNTGCCHTQANFYPPSDSGVPGNIGWLLIGSTNMCTGEIIDLVLLAQEHPESEVVVSFFSGDSSVADVDSLSGFYHLIAPGATTLTSTVLYYPLRYGWCRTTYARGSCAITVKPQITNITPAKGPIAASTSVTINGWGFGSGVTVQAGTGITVNITSFNDTQIQASFVIASSAPSGDHAVTVTAAGQTSNSVNFFVQVPTSLTVNSVQTLPTGTSGDYGCSPGFDYGIAVDIHYQVRDQSGNPINSTNMTPHENGTFWDSTPYDSNIGPTRISTTSQNTKSDGTFHDAPVGVCRGIQLPSHWTATQTITILLGGNSYTVRNQSFTLDIGTLPAQATVTNGSDINKSRP